MWEVRVYLGDDPVSGHPTQRSVTVHGELAEAERHRLLLAQQAEQLRARQQPAPRTVAELLSVWLAAEHDWKPGTWQGYRQAARRLSAEPVARRRPEQLSPPVLRAAMGQWRQQQVPDSTISLHVRTLRAALGWAFDERLIASHPLQGMRGPAQPAPRRDVPLPVVRELLAAAAEDVAGADACWTAATEARAAAGPLAAASEGPCLLAVLRSREARAAQQLHIAEQVQLLLRLAADTGARRGELTALQHADLHGRILHIDRGVSAEVVTTTKTGRQRRVTVGATTAELWQEHHRRWQQRLGEQRQLGPWMFSAHPDHDRRALTSMLGQWFTRFVRRHGHDGVCLHRLRHTVATVLVADGHLLQAQQRLGHAEASTTLRQYCHALPLHDLDTADHLDALLNRGSE